MQKSLSMTVANDYKLVFGTFKFLPSLSDKEKKDVVRKFSLHDYILVLRPCYEPRGLKMQKFMNKSKKRS